jgi:hypothetical protein
MNDLFDDDDDGILGGGGGIGDGPNIGPPYDRDPMNITLPYRNRPTQVNINLNYECPECGGRFASWDKHHITHTESEKQCPFCHTKKGEYGDQRINELKEEKEQLEERVEELEDKLESVKEAFE